MFVEQFVIALSNGAKLDVALVAASKRCARSTLLSKFAPNAITEIIQQCSILISIALKIKKGATLKEIAPFKIQSANMGFI